MKSNLSQNKNILKIVIKSTIFFFLICLITIITVCNYSNIKTFYYETNYKRNSSADNLSKLCLYIMYTKNYNKKIEYLPKLLYNDKAYNDVNKFLAKNIDKDAMHDSMQNEYLLSYLYTGRYDDFKNKYIEYYPKFKTLGPQYGYLIGVVCDPKAANNEQAKVILEALQENLPKIVDKPLYQVGNLNVQSLIYERLGDSVNEKAAQQKSQEIMTTLKKNETMKKNK